jgi:chromosome condensin MukBEF ATPase and DNA-binding subunit MukB
LLTAQSALHASQTQLQRLRDEMETTRHATDGTITCLQQELDASRAQLDGAVDAYRAQEQEVNELRCQLADAGRLQQQAQTRMQELRQELDTSRTRQNDLLQRISAAEKEIKCQEDSLNASVKIGYLSRACQEFIHRCPTWTQSTGVSLLNLSRKAALEMVNTFEEFDAVCSDPRREPVYLDSSSAAIKFNKARMALGLVLHPDKIAAKIVPHRRQQLHTYIHVHVLIRPQSYGV